MQSISKIKTTSFVLVKCITNIFPLSLTYSFSMQSEGGHIKLYYSRVHFDLATKPSYTNKTCLKQVI